MGCQRPTYTCLYQHGLLVVLVLLGICMGLWQEIITPSLPHLRAKLNVSYESIGYVLSLRNLGGIVALLSISMVYDSYPYLVHYLIAAECLIAGLVTIVIPWTRYYWLVVFFFILQSGCQNASNNGIQVLILRTFKKRSISKNQLFALGYGIGGIISGLLSQVFLPSNMSDKVKSTKYCLRYFHNSTKIKGSQPLGALITSNNTGRGFEYLYLIAGIVTVSSSIIFLLYRCLPAPDDPMSIVKKKESWLRKLSPKYTAEGRAMFGCIMTILLFLYYFFYVFGLVTFIPYIVVYAMDPCKQYEMTQKEANYLHSAVNGFFLLGRIFGSVVLGANPVISMILINMLNMFFNAILVFLSHKYPLALWIGACGMRFCNSIVYPSGTAFVDRYIIVTSSLISLAFLGDNIAAFAGSAFGGYLIDNYPSYYVTYSCMGSMFILFLSTVAMVTVGSRKGMRDFSGGGSKPTKGNGIVMK